MRRRQDFVDRLRIAAVGAIVVVLGVAAIGGGLVWGFAKGWDRPSGHTITGQQFDSVALGMARPHALHRLGRPLRSAAGGDVLSYSESQLGPVPAGTSCDYYGEANTLMDAGTMRFCYRNSDAVLAEKAAFDMGASIRGGTDTRTVCVWTSASAIPACR